MAMAATPGLTLGDPRYLFTLAVVRYQRPPRVKWHGSLFLPAASGVSGAEYGCLDGLLRDPQGHGHLTVSPTLADPSVGVGSKGPLE